MARGISAKRHAQAVFQVALQRNELARWRADLETIGSTLKDPQLFALMKHPKFRISEKIKLLGDIFTEINPLAMNLVCFLVAKNRLSLLDEITTEYDRLVDAQEGREHADVVTAIPLEEEDAGRLRDNLAQLTGKEIVLSAEVDSEIVGGLVVRVGDKLIDGSVRTRVQELKESLLGGGRSHR